MSSTLGLAWCFGAFAFGVILGRVLLLFAYGRSHETYLRRDNFRIAGGTLVIIWAYDGFVHAVHLSAQQPLTLGIFWNVIYPPIAAYGVAISYGWRRRSGIFPPLTGIPDEDAS